MLCMLISFVLDTKLACGFNHTRITLSENYIYKSCWPKTYTVAKLFVLPLQNIYWLQTVIWRNFDKFLNLIDGGMKCIVL